jgi:hypothetical protein
MKNIKVFLFIVFAGVFSHSCDEDSPLLTFTFTNENDFTIENQFPVDNPFIVPTPDVETNTSQTFENNNTSANLVETIKLTGLNLSIQSPDDFTFSFLKSIEIYISSEGLEEKLLASKEEIPTDVSEIELNTTETNLKPYLIKDTYDLNYRVVTREAFNQDVELNTFMKFKGTANPF